MDAKDNNYSPAAVQASLLQRRRGEEKYIKNYAQGIGETLHYLKHLWQGHKGLVDDLDVAVAKVEYFTHMVQRDPDKLATLRMWDHAGDAARAVRAAIEKLASANQLLDELYGIEGD